MCSDQIVVRVCKIERCIYNIKGSQIAMDDRLRVPVQRFKNPKFLISYDEIAGGHLPARGVSGVYGCYFKNLPISKEHYKHNCEGKALLYVGASDNRLRERLGVHTKRDASRSTLRKTLGCLLKKELGIELRVQRDKRIWFGDEGEALLSQWMADSLFVHWSEINRPMDLEGELIDKLYTPLNIQENPDHPFRSILEPMRKAAIRRARELPPI